MQLIKTIKIRHNIITPYQEVYVLGIDKIELIWNQKHKTKNDIPLFQFVIPLIYTRYQFYMVNLGGTDLYKTNMDP